MSEPAWPLTGRDAGGEHAGAALGTRIGERQLSLRTARKDGREVVTMRSVERGGECIGECEVYPVSGPRVGPVRPGPYRFADAEEARAFIEEAVQALRYLGCEVS